MQPTRYILTKKTNDILSYLAGFDAHPRVYPTSPGTLGLVVCHLVGGSVIAEALPSPQQFKKICGDGVPLGRLYFKVPRADIEDMCEKKIPFNWP